MTTGDILRERAIALARSETDLDDAVRDLEEACEGRRPAVVRARQLLLVSLDDDPDQPAVARGVQFLDELLTRLPA